MKCPCCDREVKSFVKNIWVSKPVCRECFFIWYDTGITEPVEIKARVLEKETQND